tara:strand:- start:277 stop:585 length:309 start_codon:yes stop_codon:yes gene_type:complete
MDNVHLVKSTGFGKRNYPTNMQRTNPTSGQRANARSIGIAATLSKNLLSGAYATQEPINPRKMSAAVGFSNNANQIRDGRNNEAVNATARNPTVERRRRRRY